MRKERDGARESVIERMKRKESKCRAVGRRPDKKRKDKKEGREREGGKEVGEGEVEQWRRDDWLRTRDERGEMGLEEEVGGRQRVWG